MASIHGVSLAKKVSDGKKHSGDSNWGWGWGPQIDPGAWRCWGAWTSHLQGESVLLTRWIHDELVPPALAPFRGEELKEPKTCLSAEGLGGEGLHQRKEDEGRRSERKELVKYLQKTPGN